jgi:hypothetical protein
MGLRTFSSMQDEYIYAGLLAPIGAIPVTAALLHGATFGAGATVGALMILAAGGLAGAAFCNRAQRPPQARIASKE